MQLSSEEINQNRLNPETIAEAVRQVRVNGYVCFEGVLDRQFINDLHDAYRTAFETFLESADPPRFENHYRMFLPFTAPFNDSRIVDNPLVLDIVEALLGGDFRCHYFASNTCLPNSEYQDTHSDIYPLFPDQDVSLPPYHIVFNVPLVDVTEENGPMEIWPGGTHLFTLPGEEIKRLAESMTSIHATMPAGTIMIRDGRMWHRGTINRSNDPRPNIALVYTRRWVNMNHLPKIEISQTAYEQLSDKAKAVFQEEMINT